MTSQHSLLPNYTVVYTVALMALGKNIKHLRELTLISRPALAKAIGAESQQLIYALESRDSKRSELATKLSEHFGVAVATLLEADLTGIDKKELRALQKTYQESYRVAVSPSSLALLAKYNGSPAVVRKAIDDLCDLPVEDVEKVAALIAAFKGT